MSDAIQSVPIYTPVQTTTTSSRRIKAIDQVRGYAMLAMLISHAAMRLSGFELSAVFGWSSHTPVAATMTTFQDWFAFVLHMASPAFFLLAGFSLALFEASRLRRGWSQAQITRFLLIRGAVLIFLDVCILGWDIYPRLEYNPGNSFVLLAIGLSIWAIAFLRRLPMRWIAAFALGLTAGTQLIYHFSEIPTDYNLLRSIFLYPGPADPTHLGFPALAWLPVMLLGFMCSRIIRERPEIFTKLTLSVGLALLAVWAVVIFFNDFGVLYPEHRLIFTKHPPGLDYLSFYLGVVFLLLALHHHLSVLRDSSILGFTLVIGQTALFFYIVHTYILSFIAIILTKLVTLPPMTMTLLISAVSLVIIFVMCFYYRRLRKNHPNSILQFL